MAKRNIQGPNTRSGPKPLAGDGGSGGNPPPGNGRRSKQPLRHKLGNTNQVPSEEGALGRFATRLGVSPKAPQIIPFEATLAFVFRWAGGKSTAIEAARLVNEPRFQQLVWAWDAASDSDQAAMKLEDLLQAVGLSSEEFLSATIPAMWKRNADISKLIAAASQPQVMEATVSSALLPGKGGFGDRKTFHINSGFLPQPGPLVQVDASHKTLNVRGGVVEDTSLPSFEASVLDADRALNPPVPLALPPATPEVIIDVQSEDN